MVTRSLKHGVQVDGGGIWWEWWEWWEWLSGGNNFLFKKNSKIQNFNLKKYKSGKNNKSWKKL